MSNYSCSTRSSAALAALSALTLYVVQSATLAPPDTGLHSEDGQHAAALAPLDPTGPRNPFCRGPFC